MDYRITVTVLLSSVVSVTRAACPDGWSPHGGKCYLYVHEPYNWFDAQSACHFMKGILVEPQKTAENQYVAALMHSHDVNEGWIGLYDIAEEGVFRWTSDGSLLGEAHWAQGEPSDSGGQEDCVGIRQNGEWNDDNCETVHFPFICEMDNQEEPIVG